MDMFDTVAAAAAGYYLHLTNMKTSQLAYLQNSEGGEDKNLPCRIRLIGTDAPEYRRKAKGRAAQIAKRRGKMDLGKMSVNQIEGLIDETDLSKIEDAVDATTGWENMPIKDESRAQFSPENARWLYETYPSILRQVLRDLEEEANVFQKA